MTEFNLKAGHNVTYQGKKYQIESPLSLEQVLLKDLETGQKISAKIAELTPLMDDSKLNSRNNVTDLTLISDADWQEAKRREGYPDI